MGPTPAIVFRPIHRCMISEINQKVDTVLVEMQAISVMYLCGSSHVPHIINLRSLDTI